ncbi:hypothetical protein GBC03_06680 [Citrobacter telavivensis]|uniref:Uncharacterized protein n=1 Tax=Citrobacter telavivensis TaxID=2653932 RepID=A0A6L5EFB8_9ENTR|nr:hypothetical protein [Citrobacter telavivensis]QFS73934.1 hypothetical protein GBC03_06680 [Citrobacter telavivensis]
MPDGAALIRPTVRACCRPDKALAVIRRYLSCCLMALRLSGLRFVHVVGRIRRQPSSGVGLSAHICRVA